MSICAVLFVAFLVLKLTNFIDWSWVWVAAPLWIPFGLWALLMLLGTLISTLGYRAINKKKKKVSK